MITCPLCRNAVEAFHKRSHMVPEWLYKDCYNQKHKMINVKLDRELVNKKQKGYYEDIICPKCEQESQLYDHYGSLILTTRAQRSPEYKAVVRKTYQKSQNGMVCRYSHWENVDFQKFQRFVFACVLRAHLSEKKKRRLLVADKHFERIRTVYKDLAIRDDMSYPILVVKYPEDDRFRDHVFLPFVNKKQNHHVIEFSGGGYLFSVFVSSHRKPDYVYSNRLKSNGSLHVLHKYFEDCGTFRSMSPTFAELGRTL